LTKIRIIGKAENLRPRAQKLVGEKAYKWIWIWTNLYLGGRKEN
jgi:hypothetical protein